MTSYLRVFGVLAAALALAGASRAQSPDFDGQDPVHWVKTQAAQEAPTAPQPQVIAPTEVKLALLDAVVTDKSGGLIKGLREEDFKVTIDGERTAGVEHVSQNVFAIALGLAVDSSGSLEGFVGQLQSAAQLLLQALKKEDRAVVVSFNDAAAVHTTLTANKQAAAAAVAQISPSGGTNLVDGVFAAAYLLKASRPEERRVLVLVSDNCDNSRGAVTPKETLDLLQALGIAFYSVTVGRDCQNRFVTGLAEATGGRLLDNGNLNESFQLLLSSLKGRYTLGFEPGEAPGFHKVELELQPRFGKKGQDYFIAHRGRYYVSRSPAGKK